MKRIRNIKTGIYVVDILYENLICSAYNKHEQTYTTSSSQGKDSIAVGAKIPKQAYTSSLSWTIHFIGVRIGNKQTYISFIIQDERLPYNAYQKHKQTYTSSSSQMKDPIVVRTRYINKEICRHHFDERLHCSVYQIRNETYIVSLLQCIPET